MATSPQVAIAAPAAAPRSSKLLIGLLLAVSLVAAGGAAYVFLVPRKAVSAEAAKPVPEKPIFVTMEPLTVNLLNGGEGRGKFLHIGIALKVRDEPSKAQISEFMPELRSRALLMLSNRAPDSLVTTEDKSKLAEEIRTELNRPLNGELPPQGIASVSFNTFVVQ